MNIDLPVGGDQNIRPDISLMGQKLPLCIPFPDGQIANICALPLI